MATDLIGARIKALREKRDLSQDDLARLFGFKDRQTVSAIETGERRVSAEELLLAIEKLGEPLDYFTNPFLLVGEGKFSWRQSGVGLPRLEAFERSAGRWIAAYRTLAPQVGRPIPLLRRTLGLTSRSSFEDAAAAGERFAAEFRLFRDADTAGERFADLPRMPFPPLRARASPRVEEMLAFRMDFAAEFTLGDPPATRLVDVMERELGLLVLMIDAFEGVSGAACRLPALDTVLINRHESPGRRHFDLGHELFHMLTWDTMPPEHVEESTEQSRNRVEQLANSFASGLLMPATVLDRFGPWDNDLVRSLNAAANALAVTATALKWRLVSLGRLGRAEAARVPDAPLRNNGRPAGVRGPVPPLFSKPFAEVIALAIEQGQVTARRAADLLDMTLEDFLDLCATHRLEAPFDL
jgi:transcriptional regulator with XRE-family HTH domain